MRLAFFAIITFTLPAFAEVPSQQSIVDLGERGMNHIGRGRNLTLFSVGEAAIPADGRAPDYVAAIRRNRELADAGRRQQAEAVIARREADQVRTEMRNAQTENQRALADAQRRLEDLSRNQTMSPEEVRIQRTTLEGEIADRARANSDYDQQLSRLDQADSDLGSKIDQMNGPIGVADTRKAGAARTLESMGVDENGAPISGRTGSAPTTGNVQVAAISPNDLTAAGPGRILVPGESLDGNALTGRGDPSTAAATTPLSGTTPRQDESEAQIRGRMQQQNRDVNATAAAAAGKKAADQGNGIPNMETIAKAMKEAQAAELKKAADAAAAKTAATAQAGGTAAQQKAAQTRAADPTQAAKTQAADRKPANVLRSAPGGNGSPTLAMNGKPAAPRDYSSRLSKEQANRIALRMAARVRDMSEPRKTFESFEVPSLPSERLAQPQSESSRLPASTR